MKIRISSNHVRLRISKEEAESLISSQDINCFIELPGITLDFVVRLSSENDFMFFHENDSKLIFIVPIVQFHELLKRPITKEGINFSLPNLKTSISLDIDFKK